jgi:hypothetical protein
MGLISGLITFVVGVLVGGLGIYVGAQLIAEEGTYTQAVSVAIVGAVVWALAESLLGWIPLLGPLAGALLAFVVYLLVLNLAYSGGWTEAAGIAVVAWLTVVVVRIVLGPLGLGVAPGVGVPGA